MVVAALSLAGCQSDGTDQAESAQAEIPVEKVAQKLVWQVEQNGSGSAITYPEATVQAPVLTAEQEEAGYAVTNALLEYAMAVDLLEEYFLTDPATVSAEALSDLEQAAYDALSEAGRAAQWAEMLVEEGYYYSSGSLDADGPQDLATGGDVLSDPDTAFLGESASLASSSLAASSLKPGLFNAESGADASSVDIWATNYEEMLYDGTPGQALGDLSGMIAGDTVDLSKALGDHVASGDNGSATARELAWRTAKGVARVGFAVATIGVAVVTAPAAGLVGGVVGGIAIAVAGADILVEVGSGIANVTMGFDNKVTAALTKTQETLAPVGFVVNLAGAGSLAGALTFLGPLALDLSEGSVAGFRVTGDTVSYVDVDPALAKSSAAPAEQPAKAGQQGESPTDESSGPSDLGQDFDGEFSFDGDNPFGGGSDFFGSDLFDGSELFGGPSGSSAELIGNWDAKIGSGVGAESSIAVIRSHGSQLGVSLGGGRFPEFIGSYGGVMSLYSGTASGGQILELQFDMESSPITAWGMVRDAGGNHFEVELRKN